MPENTKRFRSDIQGLRAIAVVAVVLDHLIHWPSGGFVGVDIFFVLSGYLITGLLLRELERTGTISFRGFYRRRVRRILPAAALVLITTSLVGLVVFNSGRAAQTISDSVWALLFSANWHFAISGTDYFQSDGPLSPVQHYWSLAVEEQFYFVWPVLMLFVFVGSTLNGKRNPRRGRLFIGGAMIAIVIGSLWWSLHESSFNPTWAYFSTFSRGWELGAGALLAIFTANRVAFSRRLQGVLAIAGLAGIVASVFLVNDTMLFPAPWAIAPVVATVLVILSGSGGDQDGRWYLAPLTNPVSQYLGKISFSLYLWHFPVLVIFGSLFNEAGVGYVMCAVVAMFVLSSAAYHFVESPILESTWLTGLSRMDKVAIKRAHRIGGRRETQKSRRVAWSLSALAVVTVVLVVVAVVPRPVTSTASVQPVQPSNSSTISATAASTIIEEVRAASVATEWPAFDPPIENLADQRVPQWTEDGCINVAPDNQEKCVWGAAAPTKTVIVMGDSIATSWLPAVIGALEPKGYSVQALTLEGCPFAAATVRPTGGRTTVFSECVEHQEWAAEQVAQINPDLIIMSDSFLSISRLISQNKGESAQSEWRAAFIARVTALPTDIPKVVLLAPPGSKNLQECFTPLSAPADCAREIPADWDILEAAEKDASAETGVGFVDTKAWFCEQDACPSFTGTTATYADTGHLTATRSGQLGAAVAESLISLGFLEK
jgi:peptidoglycan/LPS O-acetylase OafA/YrhL